MGQPLITMKIFSFYFYPFQFEMNAWSMITFYDALMCINIPIFCSSAAS